MSPTRRKVLYAVSFEICGIVVAGLSLWAMSTSDVAHTFSLSALAAGVAMVWSVAFNSVFEVWEARQPQRGRTKIRRAAHAILFEGGLLAILLPLTAWWLSVGLWQALMLEAGLVAIFLLYTYAFTWIFDRVFGLPASAR